VIVVTVRGIPAPQGSKRSVGNGRMVEMSKAVGPWREAVRAETQQAMAGRAPLDGALSVRMVFYLPRPKAHMSARGGVKPSAPGWPAGRPDLDKACRAVADALTAGGAWRDDSQMCVLVAEKLYADDYPPGALITVEELP
jgi:crossover junction endodeoxyribonuclease RusA